MSSEAEHVFLVSTQTEHTYTPHIYLCTPPATEIADMHRVRIQMELAASSCSPHQLSRVEAYQREDVYILIYMPLLDPTLTTCFHLGVQSLKAATLLQLLVHTFAHGHKHTRVHRWSWPGLLWSPVTNRSLVQGL